MQQIRPQNSRIRRAEARDRHGILALQRAAVATISDDVYPRAVRCAWWETPSPGFEDLIAAGRYFVAEVGEGLVAGAGWTSCAAPPGAAMIRGVFVHPAYHGRGLGRRLVEIAEDAAVTAGYPDILVPAALNATGFYERLGYQAGDLANFQFGPGITAQYCRMWKHMA